MNEKTVEEMESAIEAILFANGEAVSATELSEAINIDSRTTRLLARRIAERYEDEKRGLCVVETNDSFRMGTSPTFYQYVSNYRSGKKPKLSQPTIETLAIVAYKQPVSKTQIEEIRGVDASYAVNRLLEYGLIKELGRSEAAGKAILFGTTDDFLRHYGFSNLTQMPSLAPIEEEVGKEEDIQDPKLF